MKRIISTLIVSGILVLPDTAYTLTIEQMKQLAGAELLDQRVTAIITQCNLPSNIIDHSANTSTKHNLKWQSTEMNLTAGNWDLIYRNSPEPDSQDQLTGWTNPRPVHSSCLSHLTRITLFTRGNSGIVHIDKVKHKTTYTIPVDLYKAHKVIGYQASLLSPLSYADITRTYGKNYEIVKRDKKDRILRYWVLVESSQFPIALYAVDFTINKKNNTCITYQVATSEYDFVRKKFDEYTKLWEKYGVD